MARYYTYLDTPVGTLFMTAHDDTINGLHWTTSKKVPVIQSNWTDDKRPFEQLAGELQAYFAGGQLSFSLKLIATGTDFQKSVWTELCRIPFGHTRTYSEIAQAIGKPRAVRAVGSAIGSNPFMIVVPCHRVIPSGKRTGGYAGGAETKKYLLALEKIPTKPRK